MDVGTLFQSKKLIKFEISFLGYGFYGDTIVDSEANRWMGPKRYDWEGKYIHYLMTLDFYEVKGYCGFLQCLPDYKVLFMCRLLFCTVLVSAV